MTYRLQVYCVTSKRILSTSLYSSKSCPNLIFTIEKKKRKVNFFLEMDELHMGEMERIKIRFGRPGESVSNGSRRFTRLTNRVHSLTVDPPYTKRIKRVPYISLPLPVLVL